MMSHENGGTVEIVMSHKFMRVVAGTFWLIYGTTWPDLLTK
jgi:hypothetical protein